MKIIKVKFDGGQPCNIPRLGYGEGYGSFSINDENPIRLKFGAVSNNVAEIKTATEASKEVIKRYGACVHIYFEGDSQIALKWISNETKSGKKAKFSKGVNQAFKNSVSDLHSVLFGIQVSVNWVPRLQMVAVFGH